MKHMLYIYFSVFLFKWYIFRINGKLIKSENNESIKSNLRNGSVKFWNPSNEDNYGNKNEFFHNLSTKHKNNENDFNKDNDESVYNTKNISRNRFNNVLRNLGASRDIHLQQKNLHEKGKLIEHMTTDDEDKEKYIKGEEEEGQEEDQKEAMESEEAQRRAQEEERVAKEKEEAQRRAQEEERVAKEKEEAQRRAQEEERVAKEKEEAQRRAQEEERVAKEKEEAQRRAQEEERVAKEKEEAQRRAQEEERVAKEKEEAQRRAQEEERVAKEKEEAQRRALEEQRVAKEKEEAQQRVAAEGVAAKKKNLVEAREHGDVSAEDLYDGLEIPVIELPSEDERGYYLPHQSSLPNESRGDSRDSEETSIIDKPNRESIKTDGEGRRDINKGHLEEKKDGSIKPEQKQDKSTEVQNLALEIVNISDVNDFQISKYEDEISAEYDDSFIDEEEEDDEDLDEFKPIMQYENFQDEENIGMYKELEELIEKNDNLDDLDEIIEKSSEELSEEKKKGKKYEKTKDNNLISNEKSLYDEHIKKYKNVKHINREKEKFKKSVFHIFDRDNEIVQIVNELSEDITKYFLKL